MKYVTILEQGDGTFRAWVRVPGLLRTSESKLKSKEAAETWARGQLRPLDEGQRLNLTELSKSTLGQLMQRWIDEVAPKRPYGDYEAGRLQSFMQHRMASATLDTDLRPHIAAWFAGLTKGPDAVAGGTANRYLNVLLAVFKSAKNDWKMKFLNGNPAKGHSRYPDKPARITQVWTDDDLRIVLDACGFDITKPPGKTTRDELGWLVMALRASGLRPITLLRTKPEWVDLANRVVRYPGTSVKNHDAYNMPLDDMAADVFAALLKHRAGRDWWFSHSYKLLAQAFYRLREKLAEDHPHMAGLVIYENRHTWTTANVQHFSNLAEFMAYTGRKNVKVAMRYYKPGAKALAEGLERSRSEAKAKATGTTDSDRLSNLEKLLVSQAQQHAQQMNALIAALGRSDTTTTTPPGALPTTPAVPPLAH